MTIKVNFVCDGCHAEAEATTYPKRHFHSVNGTNPSRRTLRRRSVAIPIQRHPFCEENHCPTCLTDACLLEEHLLDEMGVSNRNWDILGTYRSWLDREGIKAETQFGWFHPNVFDPSIAERFIHEWTRED